MLPKYSLFRDWFFPTYSEKERAFYKENFYGFIHSHKIIIPFVHQFLSYNKIDKELGIIEDFYKE